MEEKNNKLTKENFNEVKKRKPYVRKNSKKNVDKKQETNEKTIKAKSAYVKGENKVSKVNNRNSENTQLKQNSIFKKSIIFLK